MKYGKDNITKYNEIKITFNHKISVKWFITSDNTVYTINKLLKNQQNILNQYN